MNDHEDHDEISIIDAIGGIADGLARRLLIYLVPQCIIAVICHNSPGPVLALWFMMAATHLITHFFLGDDSKTICVQLDSTRQVVTFMVAIYGWPS